MVNKNKLKPKTRKNATKAVTNKKTAIKNRKANITTKVVKAKVRKKSFKPEEKKIENKLALLKAEQNPIISPNEENGWECWQTFNPAAILLNDNVYLVYRAIGSDCISRLGYAFSRDGFSIDEQLPNPIYEHLINFSNRNNFRPVFNYYSFASGGSFGGAEDPRITRVGEEDKMYMIYTACGDEFRLALTSISVRDFLNKNWKWKSPVFISKPNEFYKNWVIFPEKIRGKYAILHGLLPEILIAYFDNLDFEDGMTISSYYPRDHQKKDQYIWEEEIRGACASPIKTKYGWLLFYHAIEKNSPGRYKVGAMLLDLNDPTKILFRSPKPVLEAEEVYEICGCKGGTVYASSAIVKDKTLFIYYGSADNYVCVAYANLEKFLQELTQKSKPKLKRKSIKRNF